MVRTNSVKLNVIDAITYRQKLPAGSSGIVIIRKAKSRQASLFDEIL